MQVSDLDWLQKSQVIREYHKCTHFIWRNLYPEKTDAVRDELIADAIGIYAADGLSREEQLNSLAAGCDRAIEAIRLIFQQHENAAPFKLIPALVNGHGQQTAAAYSLFPKRISSKSPLIFRRKM